MLGETGYVLETATWTSAALEVVSRDGLRTPVNITIFPLSVVDGEPLAVWLFRPAARADHRGTPQPGRGARTPRSSQY